MTRGEHVSMILQSKGDAQQLAGIFYHSLTIVVMDYGATMRESCVVEEAMSVHSFNF